MILFPILVGIQALENSFPKDIKSTLPNDPSVREMRIEPRPQIYIPISSVTIVAQIF